MKLTCPCGGEVHQPCGACLECLGCMCDSVDEPPTVYIRT